MAKLLPVTLTSDKQNPIGSLYSGDQIHICSRFNPQIDNILIPLSHAVPKETPFTI